MPHYRTTFLKQVILRLDYGRLPALQVEQETPFTADMRARYPEVNSNQAQQFALMMAPGGLSHQQVTSAGWVRVHRAQGTARSVTLAPEFVAIEYGEKSYQHFEELEEQFSFVLDSFRRHFRVTQFTRIGLRYVNEITLAEGSALEWDGLISPNLVISIKAGLFGTLRMHRSLHQLTASKDDMSVVLTYGINNPDFPGPVARRQFILDLDCYISEVIASVEAEQRIKDLNGLAEYIFESSIENGLREKMEVIQ